MAAVHSVKSPAPLRSISLLLLLVPLARLAAAPAPKWSPPDPAELASTQPVVDPDAGAEILLREVTMDSADFDEALVKTYVRVKVYSARGVERLSKIELPFTKQVPITRIAARTIHPDGRIVELDRKEVFEREVLRADSIRVKVKSFAPPALVPGAIVEYTYTEEPGFALAFFPLWFQTDLPAREVRFHIHTIETPLLGLRALLFNCPDQSFEADRDGFRHFRLTNVAAISDEPFSPPALTVRPTVLVYYTFPFDIPQRIYWHATSSLLETTAEKKLGPTRRLKALLATLNRPGESAQDSVVRYYDYCRTKLVNFETDSAKLTPKQRRKLPRNDDIDDTLKHGGGTSYDINLLFAALARSTGLVTRLAWVGDRQQMFFSPRVTEVFALPRLVVAVRLGADWSYFDPAGRYLPPGQLDWNNTDTHVLLGDPDHRAPEPLPGAPAEFSQRKRSGKFQLQPDGTLDGEVTVTYTGLWETEMKRLLGDQSPEERAATLRQDIQACLPQAELSAAIVENADDPLSPLRVAFHLRIPDFAERTGSRLFFQPAVFQKGAKPMFDQADRKQDVVLRYRSTSKDDITITLPPEFSLEDASAPPSLTLGQAGSYRVTLGRTKPSTVVYRRELVLNGIQFPRTSYPMLKKAFDEILVRDGHTLTLRRSPLPDESTPAEKS